MDHFEDLLTPLVRGSYIRQGLEAIKSRQNLLEVLLIERKIPMDGWDDSTIEYMIHQLSMMDSNNFPGNIGLGEREGRIFSSLVSKRHYGLAHGIGRSGDISEVQPKAAGSSTLYKLANCLVQNALEISGFAALRKSLIIPMATGMTIALSLLSLRQSRPHAKYVIWPRIDQKSCFKAILTVGMIPIVVENQLNGDEISTNVDELRRVIGELNPDDILCILTTTSCFAPRRPDRIDLVSQICKDLSIPHVINNAYGLQCPLIAKLLTRAVTVGRVDFVVQSTDKNFMVPVGGAVLSSPTPDLIDQAAKLYPGRASSSPIVDVFITLLSMGQRGLLGLHQQRLQCLPLLIDGVQRVATEFGERVLISPCNSISIGLTVSQSLAPPQGGYAGAQRKPMDPAFIGSMLFKRSVSGARVVAIGNSSTKIGDYSFKGWGSHINDYHSSYLTVACAVGVTSDEVASSLIKIRKVFLTVRKMGQIPDSISPRSDELQENIDSVSLSSQWIDMYQRKARNIG